MQQVAAQIERLLWLAYRLKLQPLVQRLHQFVRASTLARKSLLRGKLDAVFTQRVMEAADVSSISAGKQGFIDSILGQVVSLASEPVLQPETVLLPVTLSPNQLQPICFNATVMKGSLLAKPTDSTMEVELDLFKKGQIRIGRNTHLVQLRIGPHWTAQE
ncbi:hypothetical protein COO60DRAFT_1643548 [Scenedesmus sp. NREL 46B-D3]|nr:hypothetical protein COO60DRAFT_1643548 [Scenedesmus sp. NREL 46B-D3]